MRNIKKKLNWILVLIFIISICFMGTAYAKEFDPDDYRPDNPSRADVEPIVNMANPIIGTIRVAGIVIAVITLTVLGIKYMTGSVSEKAEYKKTMIPYIIGAFLVVAITQILGVIIELVAGIQ